MSLTRLTFSFLICSERSGSNLLLSILSAHSRICAPPPSHLFRLFSTNAQNYGRLSDDTNWHTLLQDFIEAFDNQLGQWQTHASFPYLSEQCRQRHVLEPVRLAYELEANQIGADHVFVKENHTAEFASDLNAFLPACRFVHMIRDPRDVAASYLSTDGIPGGVERAVRVWSNDQARAAEASESAELAPLILTLRYEDLLASPAETLTCLMSHLDLEFEAEMLDFHQSEQVRNNVSRVAAWNNLSRPIMKNNTGKYAGTLTKAEIEYVELLCHDLMEKHGYSPEHVGGFADKTQCEQRAAELVPELRPGHYEVGSENERSVRERRLAVINKVTARRLR